MTKRQLHDVHPGQVWRDRDARMLSGNRRVKVTKCVRDGDKVTVFYRSAVGDNGVPFGAEYKSRYDRFQRAFDIVPSSVETSE
jgi:hypothetical protein